MATPVATGTCTWHGALTPNEVTEVTISTPSGVLILMNRSTDVDVFFRVDGTDPVAGADGSYVLRPGTVRTVTVADAKNPSVKLIAGLAAPVSVELNLG